MARRKKVSSSKTMTLWGVKYTYDPKSQKWMEGKKEASALLSGMLEDLYEKFEKTKGSPQDREETEILLSPLPQEEKEEVVQEVKEDAKLQRAEAEQKVKTSPESEKLEILKPNIEVESLISPTESVVKDKTEKKLPRLESTITPDALKERVKGISLSTITKDDKAKTGEQDRSLINLFEQTLKRMQETGTATAGSEMLKDALTNLNKTLGTFATKTQEQKIVSDDKKTERVFEKATSTEKSSDYLKSIDGKIAEILNFLKSEEKEEDAQETEVEAESAKRKLEESYSATGAELSKSVNDAMLGPADERRKGLFDSRLGKQFDANFARRLDEDLPILNLFTDKLQEMKEDISGEGGSGVTILGDSFRNIGRSIKRGTKSIFRAGAAGARGVGKLFSGVGSIIGRGAGKLGGLFKGTSNVASGLLGKMGGMARGAGSLIGSAAKNMSSFGKTVGLGAVGIASGAMTKLGSSAKAVGSLAKGFGKSFVKKIPLLGALAGLGFGAQRAFSGDFSGAAMEVGSGLAGTIPGVGTAASIGIDAALAARDMGAFDSDGIEKTDEAEMQQIAEQQKPKITNQTSALKEFETQRQMIQDKRSAATTAASTTIINNNKSDRSSPRGGATGIMSTAGATRSLYLNYYVA